MLKIGYRTVIKFFSKEGLAPAAFKQCLDGVYGEASPSYSTVKEQATQFCLGSERVKDEPRERQLVEVVTEENIRRIEEELLSDRQLKLKEISVRLEIPKTTVIRIIHEHLHMKKVSARWVPWSSSAPRQRSSPHGVVAKTAVKKCGFKQIEHPPYSPDLAPSNYYLFSKLQNAL
jgi:histone-lysine N-methyltransferase SETMAR